MTYHVPGMFQTLVSGRNSNIMVLGNSCTVESPETLKINTNAWISFKEILIQLVRWGWGHQSFFFKLPRWSAHWPKLKVTALKHVHYSIILILFIGKGGKFIEISVYITEPLPLWFLRTWARSFIFSIYYSV